MADQLLFIPGPVTCAPDVLAAMARPTFDHRGPEFAALLRRIEIGMQPIFGTVGDVLVLGGSGTGGLETAVVNAFSPGDTVIACPVGLFGKRLIAIARANGLNVEVIETAMGAAVDPQALAARLEADTGRQIAGILLTHNETSTGVQNDMAALSFAIGDHPATVVVDSVSGLGASAFHMDSWGFDVVVTASQKALAVPPGLAMIAVGARGWERMAKATVPRFYFDLGKAREFAKLGQTPWTPPISIMAALGVALDRFEAEGAERVHERHAAYANAIRAFAKASGIELFSHDGAHSVTVVAMKLPAGLEAPKIRAALRERFGIVIGGGQAELKGKILRMGTMGDLTHGDVLGALAALATVLREQGFAMSETAGVDAAKTILSGGLVAAFT